MAFLELLGNPPPAGWQGRIREAAYTSPLGVRIPFYYEQVSRETEKRTAKFQFNGLNGWYVQDNGHGGRDYPLRCIFWGPDHDQLATSFEVGLLERGVGELEHPLYGTFKVVPTGTISRRNDLVQGANQSVVEVTFSTTLADIYPSGQGFPVSEILAAVDGFNVAAALQFQDSTTLTSAVDQATSKATVRALLGQVRESLEFVAAQTADAKRAFDSNYRLINEGIDVLIGQPLLLAQRVSNLIQAPARALAGIASRLEGYARLAESIFGSQSGSNDGSTLPSDIRENLNNFRISDLFALNAVAGSVLSIASNTFSSRPEALQAATEILDQLDSAVTWREGRIDGLGTIDTGEGYQAIQDATAQAGAYLVGLSFDLLPERSIVTDRARTAVDLCAELYGDLSDERLQFLIDTNMLSGSEILEIPKDRTIVYYV